MMTGPKIRTPHRSPTRRNYSLASIVLLVALPGCLNPAAPPPVRIFDPPVSIEDAPTSTRAKPLRLIAVTSRRMIGEYMIWRMTKFEIAFDELNRWSESPDRLVDRALRKALFTSGAFRKGTNEEVAEQAIEVHVTTFEYDLPRHQARVQLEIVRRNADGSAQTKEFAAEVAAEQTAEDYARAMGTALSRVVTQVRGWLTTG